MVALGWRSCVARIGCKGPSLARRATSTHHCALPLSCAARVFALITTFRQATIAERDATIAEQGKQIQERDAVISDLNLQLAALSSQVPETAFMVMDSMPIVGLMKQKMPGGRHFPASIVSAFEVTRFVRNSSVGQSSCVEALVLSGPEVLKRYSYWTPAWLSDG
jgi:hypothetical protein